MGAGGQHSGADAMRGTDVESTQGAACPDTIGRYTVLRRIGSGAMGTVFEAHDPELARKVALKLLGQVEGGGPERKWRRDRLRREAQALAQLSHENVVSVYDVGTVRLGDGGERVYLSMQLVEGADLAAWLRQRPVHRRTKRDMRELLGIFVSAGRGLAAAHEVGLVHRDFKPANVLIGTDGSVRVADFGLARSTASTRTATEDQVDVSPHDDTREAAAPLLGTMTLPGAVMGTPPYMAPEQFLGDEVDSRSDQFSFCVALYEALHGERPFAGTTFSSLRRNVTRGHISAVPDGVRVPARLRRIALRGLSTDPDQRYPTMDALVADLARDPAVRRRRVVQVVGVGIVVAAVTTAVLARPGTRPDTRCTHAADHLDGVWDNDRKSAIERAFKATKRPHAQDVFQRVSTRLDTHFATWVAVRTNTCAATHIRGEQSPAVMDLRMRCLDRRLSEARALVALLGQAPDSEILNKAIDAVTGLPGADLCDDAALLGAVIPPPTDPDKRAKASDLEQRLDAIDALQYAGKYRRGLELAKAVAAEAATLGYAPIAARALYARAMLEADNGDFVAAEDTYYAAARAAGEAHDDRLLAHILIALVSVVGDRHGDSKNTSTLAALAAAAVARVGTPPALQAELLNSHGNTAQTQAKYVVAQRYYEQALALRRGALGQDHPDVARSINGIAVALYYQEKLAESEVQYRRALTLLERALGPDHPHVAAIAGNLGNAILDQERPDEALPFHQRALAVRQRTLGDRNVYTANSLHSLGRVSMARKDYPGALTYYRRALDALQAALGAEYPDVGVMMADIGDVLRLQGKHAEARKRYVRGIAIVEAALGKDHLRTARPRTGLSLVERALGHHDAAVRVAERAVKILAARDDRHESLATARFALARALWDARRSRSRSLTLARQARDAFASGPGADAASLREVTAWLGGPARRTR